MKEILNILHRFSFLICMYNTYKLSSWITLSISKNCNISVLTKKRLRFTLCNAIYVFMLSCFIDIDNLPAFTCVMSKVVDSCRPCATSLPVSNTETLMDAYLYVNSHSTDYLVCLQIARVQLFWFRRDKTAYVCWTECCYFRPFVLFFIVEYPMYTGVGKSSFLNILFFLFFSKLFFCFYS